MPYPNEHACRLVDPDKLKIVGSEEREHEGKKYRIIFGLPKSGEGGSVEQAYRYPKDIWSKEQAEKHCKDHNGEFEPARETEEKETRETSVYIRLNEMENDNKLVEVKILYPDEFHHKAYGKFRVTKKDLENAVKNFNAGIGAVKDSESWVLPGTYEHPMSGISDPEMTKASGWIRELILKEDGLYAKIEFTNKAKEYIKNKEFKFISPVFEENFIDEQGQEHGFTLRGFGLTNWPFLKKGQVAIALNENYYIKINETKEEKQMQDQKQEITDELKKLTDELSEKVKRLEELETENKKLKEEIEKLTPKNGEVKITVDELNALKKGAEAGIEAQKKLALMEAEALVDDAIKARKILPSQKAQMVQMALSDRKWFEEFLKNTPPLPIELGEKGTDGDAVDSSEKLVKLIEKYAAEKNISFIEAKRRMKSENPDLFKNYE